MKRNISLLLIFLLTFSVLIFTSCELYGGEFEFTFVLGDGRPEVKLVINGLSELYEPEAAEDGKVFGGWYTDAEHTAPYIKRRHTEPQTLYALWLNEGSQSLTLIYGDGRENTHIIYEGTLPPIDEPIREGYIFDYWYDTDTGKRADFASIPDNVSTVLEARWKKINDTAKVTIVYGDGREDASLTVATGKPVSPPEIDVKSGYTLVGWYTDAKLEKLYDFSKPLLSDLTLYAKWIEDKMPVVNHFSTEVIKSTVTLTVSRTKREGGQIITSTSTGSGVIFKEIEGHYYCLTNYHVIEAQGFPSIKYEVTDYKGNRSDANIIYESAEYDLALFSFVTGERLQVSELAQKRADVGSFSVSIGSPGGVENTVTFGEILCYKTVEVKDSLVTIPVGWHTTPIAQGSSGGGVFNKDDEIIGINYAGAEADGDGREYAFFIPVDEVINFLVLAEQETGVKTWGD